MALTTVAEVRRLGGLFDENAFRLWFLDDEPSLDQMITEEIELASAYLTFNAGSDYTQTADTAKMAIFRRAEAYWVLMQITEPLKARKVYGKHAPYASEESLSYERLIDEEWQRKFEMLVGRYILDDTGNPYSLGVFLVSAGIDRFSAEILTVPEIYQELLDEANGVGETVTA